MYTNTNSIHYTFLCHYAQKFHLLTKYKSSSLTQIRARVVYGPKTCSRGCSRTMVGCSRTMVGCSRTMVGCSRTMVGCSRTMVGCSRTMVGCSRTMVGCSRTMVGCSRTMVSLRYVMWTSQHRTRFGEAITIRHKIHG